MDEDCCVDVVGVCVDNIFEVDDGVSGEVCGRVVVLVIGCVVVVVGGVVVEDGVVVWKGVTVEGDVG